MAFARGSQSELAYVVESSFGVTPSSPSTIELPVQSHSLSLSKERIEGNNIVSDRTPRVDRHGTRTVAGDISVWLAPDDYDDLLESVFFDTFPATGTTEMIGGVTPQYITLEDRLTDIGQYIVYTGMTGNTLNVSASPNSRTEATFNFVGKDAEISSSELATPTASSYNNPFDNFSGSISIGGSEVAILTSIDFTVDNQLNPAFVLGSNTAPQLGWGRRLVTGNITAYFEDAAFFNRFSNETSAAIQIVFDDQNSGSTYTFDFPSCKFNSADTPLPDDSLRTITTSFVSLFDNSTDSNIKLTKS